MSKVRLKKSRAGTRSRRLSSTLAVKLARILLLLEAEEGRRLAAEAVRQQLAEMRRSGYEGPSLEGITLPVIAPCGCCP
jgi:hypothetical protein